MLPTTRERRVGKTLGSEKKSGLSLRTEEKKFQKTLAERIRKMIPGLPLRKVTDLVPHRKSGDSKAPQAGAAVGVPVGLALHHVL